MMITWPDYVGENIAISVISDITVMSLLPYLALPGITLPDEMKLSL